MTKRSIPLVLRDLALSVKDHVRRFGVHLQRLVLKKTFLSTTKTSVIKRLDWEVSAHSASSGARHNLIQASRMLRSRKVSVEVHRFKVAWSSEIPATRIELKRYSPQIRTSRWKRLINAGINLDEGRFLSLKMNHLGNTRNRGPVKKTLHRYVRYSICLTKRLKVARLRVKVKKPSPTRVRRWKCP